MAVSHVSTIKADFIVIWLDKDIEKTRENRDTKALLRLTVGGYLETFDDLERCADYILNVSKKRVFLIVSSLFGAEIVPLIHPMPQIETIYVFCVNRERAEKWTQNYEKITGIFTNKKFLMAKLTEDLSSSSYDENSHLSMSIFHLEDKQLCIRDLRRESASFMWFQMLLVVLRHLAKLPTSKDEMIRECRSLYRNDPIEMRKIEQFEKEYQLSEAIWWYTYDCFVYRLLNRALRTQNVDIIFKFRFFIKDLYSQVEKLFAAYLKQHQPLKKHRLTVYRGQHLTTEELNLLMNNVDGLISMNTFLSATLNKDLARIFAEVDPRLAETGAIHSILFIIEICDLDQKITVPFAPIKSYSCFQDEDEILFAIGAIFKVQRTEKIDNIWHIHLQSSREENELYQNLSDHFIQKIGFEASPLTLGWFLFRMNDFNQAERYALSLLEQLPVNNPESGNVHTLLGLIYKDTGRAKDAIASYNEALKIFSTTSPPNSPQVAVTHYNCGLAYLAIGDNESAAQHQKESEKKLMNSASSSNPVLISMTKSLKGKIEATHGNYAEALEDLYDALKSKEKQIPSGHPSLASSWKDIGIVHFQRGEDQKAMDAFDKAVAIYQKTLISDHLDLGDCYMHMAHVHYRRQNYIFALDLYKKALDITQNASREDFETVSMLNRCIADTTAQLEGKTTKNSYDRDSSF